MHHKSRTIGLSIKSVADDGTFEGLLSPYGNVDQGGDVVEPGAFTNSLKANGNTVPMLWQHKPDCPIGSLQLDDREDGLWCKGTLLLDIAEAQKAYSLLKAKIINGLSIGYETVKAKSINGVRHLLELNLFEGSVVTFPMNTSALISAVKQRESKGDFAEEFNSQQISDQLGQMLSALSSSLCPLPWAGLSRDETLSAAETVLQQFTDTYMTYLPLYLDFLATEYGMDVKSWQTQHEAKEGRTISASTHQALSTALEHATKAADCLTALLKSEADDPNALATKAHADLIGKMLGLLR